MLPSGWVGWNGEANISFTVHFLSVKVLRPPFSVSSLDKETLTGAHAAQEFIIIQ